MKNTDVTKSVMDNVISYESHRTRIWLGVFLTALFVAIGLILALIRYIYGTLLDRHTLDVLEIVFQDSEIISEFWQDALVVVWEEFPKFSLYIGFGLMVLFGVMWIRTKKKRKIMARRIEELAKRQKRRNNT